MERDSANSSAERKSSAPSRAVPAPPRPVTSTRVGAMVMSNSSMNPLPSAVICPWMAASMSSTSAV